MTAAKFPPGTATSSPKTSLPTMYDLPSEDPEEPGLPDEYHLWQAQLCSLTFRPPAYPSEQVFVASDLNLYYDVEHPRWYKRPDWYAVVGGSRLYEGSDLRLSYVIWQEQVTPIVAMEFLSPSTEAEDLGQRQWQGPQPSKWEVYEQILAIPYYVVFSRYTDKLQVFRLEAGRYREQRLTESRIWLSELELGLGLWQGEYCGVTRQWLRWFDRENRWIATDAERERQQKETAQLQRDRERQQKEQALKAQLAAEQRAAKLAERLKQLGIDPDEI